MKPARDQITATVIAHSIGVRSPSLITLQLRYPLIVHNELMTHRVFSRNTASSRAIPVERMIQEVENNPFIPMVWGKNQPGMQAFEELDVVTADRCEQTWMLACFHALESARQLHKLGVHKQVANRLLGPFIYTNVVVTATEWDNWFELRDHKDAEPHIRLLAQKMREAINASVPIIRKSGEWHLPYVNSFDWGVIRQLEPYGDAYREVTTERQLELARKLSVARCASVSYMTVEGLPMSLDRAEAIYDRLYTSKPFHASPFEHQATPDVMYRPGSWKLPGLHGNFKGWIQLRKQMERDR